MKLQRRLFNPALGLTVAIAAGACGDISNSDADARPIDAGDAIVDGGVDAAAAPTRRGSVAILELEQYPFNALQVKPRGMDVRIEFRRLDEGSAAPVLGDSTTGACTVWHHPSTSAVADSTVDEGQISYSGAALVDSPSPTCKWLAGAYACIVDEVTNVTASIGVGGLLATLAGPVDFTAPPYLGAHGLRFQATGFTSPGNNRAWSTLGHLGGSEPAGRLPVVPNYRFPVPDNPQTENNATGVGWVAYLDGPYPRNFQGSEHAMDFLSPETTAPGTLTVNKAQGAVLPSFTTTVTPAGQGFGLDAAYDVPEKLPFTARDITFGCTGGQCTPPTGEALELFSITGHTTSTAIENTLDLYSMPPSLPGTTWAEFECHFIGGTSATIPAEVWAKVLETNPKRIETTVSYSSAKIFVDDGNRTMIRVGHGHRGYSTIAPPN